MKSTVLKPFRWCPDGTGVTEEELAVGDERDFGASSDALAAEGYIAGEKPEEAKTTRRGAKS